jgi:hypothetical protein
MAARANEMAGPDLPIYPNPSLEHCAACVFQAPCIAMNEGADPQAILDASFRRRTPDEGEEDRLRWSVGRAQTRASLSGNQARPATANLHWG